jgi:uncharacterized protein YndB with AHSA1/START domain
MTMTSNANSEPEELRSHSTQRAIKAPCAKTFSAFCNPAHLARWWGPNGFSNTFKEFDLREGGYWRFTMHGPDGKDYWNESVFLEVKQNERVVLEHHAGHHFLLTITFAPVGDSTVVGWRQVFDSIEHYNRIATFVAQANEQNLDRLTAEVELLMTLD